MGTKNNPGDYDCYEKADPDEPMFTLLARDKTAPYLTRQWASMRWMETLRQDNADLEHERKKVLEAMHCADAMEAWWEEDNS